MTTSSSMGELREEIRNIYDDPRNPEYTLEDIISAKALDQLVALFIAHQNRILEDVIKELESKKMKEEGSIYEISHQKTVWHNVGLMTAINILEGRKHG